MMNSNRYRLPCLLALLLPPLGTVQAQNEARNESLRRFEKPQLTVRVAPINVHVQEQVIHSIQLDSAFPFNKLTLDAPDADNARIISLIEPSVRPFKSWGVEGFSYEISRAIYPKSSGELIIAPVTVSGEIVRPDGSKEPFVRRTKPVRLVVRTSADELRDDPWLIASSVRMQERWSKPLPSLRVGDTVTRTITVIADGTTGQHLPDLVHGGSTGMTVLPGPVKRSTQVSRTSVQGRLEQSFDLRMDAEQVIDVRSVRLAWFDAKADRARSALVPVNRFEPLPRDVSAIVNQAMQSARDARDRSLIKLYTLLGCVVLGSLLAVAWRARRTKPKHATRGGRHAHSLLNKNSKKIELPEIGINEP